MTDVPNVKMTEKQNHVTITEPYLTSLDRLDLTIGIDCFHQPPDQPLSQFGEVSARFLHRGRAPKQYFSELSEPAAVQRCSLSQPLY